LLDPLKVSVMLASRNGQGSSALNSLIVSFRKSSFVLVDVSEKPWSFRTDRMSAVFCN
jgi:hypothetical protein